MAWRYNDPVKLELTRQQAVLVDEAITYFVEEVFPDDTASNAVLRRVLDLMGQQIEHKPGTGPLRNKSTEGAE